ncbi:MAG: hypothetical protein J3R72DRAFT_419025 [Linnemannia gamsii]|nr:MAG: hypothetical protein J3R72DRAFT_419025 [Linnemannia gamsii]
MHVLDGVGVLGIGGAHASTTAVAVVAVASVVAEAVEGVADAYTACSAAAAAAGAVSGRTGAEASRADFVLVGDEDVVVVAVGAVQTEAAEEEKRCPGGSLWMDSWPCVRGESWFLQAKGAFFG